ncbi:hypothetical protein B0H10DRAFT_2217504 [Mycena sp. CBHHK59/15]|nr:hypothetical protein B0H10DRAFT_2217504 [Mycena sp. CBHHK59/15]
MPPLKPRHRTTPRSALSSAAASSSMKLTLVLEVHDESGAVAEFTIVDRHRMHQVPHPRMDDVPAPLPFVSVLDQPPK